MGKMLFLQSSALLAMSCFFLIVTNGQEELETDWPIIVDPFPDSDDIGPEPEPTPPPTPDCTLACQEKVDEAFAQINHLQQQLTDTNFTLFSRIIDLGANSGGGDLTQRVTNLEAYLPGNVSTLTDKINTDVALLQAQLSDEISALRLDLETKIDNISQGGGGGAQATEVYVNLTQRINTLERGKIQHLITDNNLWRQNFRVINATFAKMKKSSRGNNVIITG